MKRSLAPWSEVALAVVCAGAVVMASAGVLAGAYGVAALLLPAVVAVGSAMALAVLAERLRWSWGVSVLVAWVGYGAGALMLATPGAVMRPDRVVPSVLDVLMGPVVGWRGVVTLPAPLGTYEGVMVPAYALLFVGAWAAVSVALRQRSRWWLGPVVAASVFAIAIVVGPAMRGRAPALFGVTLSREVLLGVLAFAALLAWFITRAALERARMRRNAGASTTAARRRWGGVAAATVMVVAAAAIAGAAMWIVPDGPRTVARSHVEAATVVATSETPLSTYRTFFGEDSYDDELFTVEGAGDAARVRLAVLPHFDGDRYTLLDRSGSRPVVFSRLPASRGILDGSEPLRVTITVQGLSGAWTPLVGELDAISFDGAREAALVDSFYYVPAGGAGVTAIPGGLTAGDVIRLDAVPDTAADAVDAVGSASSLIEPDLVPQSLVTWVEAQGLGRDAVSLLELIDRLRSRGFVSHAVIESPDGDYAWQEHVPDSAFVSSPAGHSTSRIESLFAQLNDREAEIGGVAGDEAPLLVAAVGDDEQFAAASAVLAGYLGFESRVVVGARLTETDARGWSPPACGEGVCTGAHMSAWIEVATPAGWAAIDTSPQNEWPLAPDVESHRDPEFASDMRDDHADVLDPPSSQRSRSGESEERDEVVREEPFVLPTAVRIAAVSAVGLVALMLPWVVILLWKGLRRVRRRSGDPAAAVRGGWEQYRDDAADAGVALPRQSTHRETAEQSGSPHGYAIAALATKVDFAHLPVTAEEAQTMWDLIREDRKHWLHTRSWWRRLRMRLSLRSLRRGLEAAPVAQVVQGRTATRTWKTENTAMTRSQVETRSKSRGGRRGKVGRHG